MGFKLSKYISELLLQYGKVKIPGLGTFVSFQDSGNPKVDTTKNNNILLEHVMNSTEMDRFTASKFISEQVDLIKIEVDKGTLVYLDSIGHLYRNHVNKFVFLPEKNNFDKTKFHQPELQLQPITNEEIESVKSLVKKSPQKRSKLFPKISTIAPIAALLVACVLFFSIMLNRDAPNNDGDFQKLPVAEKRINEKPMYTPPEETKKDIDGEFKTKIDTEAATFGPKVNECVIIIGQFRSKDGASKRVSQIYDFGYDAFQDKHNGLTRVGVQFAYENEAEIKAMLKKVQKRFDSKAWVLKQ